MHLADPLTTNAIGRYITPTAQPQPSRAATSHVVIHHAAATYPPGAACARIFAYHAQRWPSYGRIGYHEVIQEEPGGALQCYLVNPPEMVGAGVYGRNDTTYHLCAATKFTGIPSAVWIEALAQRAAAALMRWPQAQLVGHTDIALPTHRTACPGAHWASWQHPLRARVAVLLAAGGTAYRFVVDQVAYADWQLSQPAPTVAAPHYWRRGDQVDVDAIQGHVAHAGPAGFVPLGALERL